MTKEQQLKVLDEWDDVIKRQCKHLLKNKYQKKRKMYVICQGEFENVLIFSSRKFAENYYMEGKPVVTETDKRFCNASISEVIVNEKNIKLSNGL